jgi:hypothetical protein
LLTPQKVADLIAYIDASAIPPKTFPGNQPALVKQDEAGALRLRASNAEIYGERLGFEAKYKNLGTWHGRNDRSVWTVQVPSSGSYEVWLHWACPAGEAGDDFRFRIGDVSLTGIVPSTGTWDLYKHAKFGTLELKAGQQRAVFEAQPPLKSYLIDLLEVRLVPANAATPAPAFEQVGSAHKQSASK